MLGVATCLNGPDRNFRPKNGVFPQDDPAFPAFFRPDEGEKARPDGDKPSNLDHGREWTIA
jgi:hypothetical protein